ncbi:MAG: hypothetical protein MHM6MM_000406 [Cercozoa sp. M6MM]
MDDARTEEISGSTQSAQAQFIRVRLSDGTLLPDVLLSREELHRAPFRDTYFGAVIRLDSTATEIMLRRPMPAYIVRKFVQMIREQQDYLSGNEAEHLAYLSSRPVRVFGLDDRAARESTELARVARSLDRFDTVLRRKSGDRYGLDCEAVAMALATASSAKAHGSADSSRQSSPVPTASSEDDEYDDRGRMLHVLKRLQSFAEDGLEKLQQLNVGSGHVSQALCGVIIRRDMFDRAKQPRFELPIAIHDDGTVTWRSFRLIVQLPSTSSFAGATSRSAGAVH